MLEIYSWLNNSGHAKNLVIISLVFFSRRIFSFFFWLFFYPFCFWWREKKKTQKIHDSIESYCCRNEKKCPERKKKFLSISLNHYCCCGKKSICDYKIFTLNDHRITFGWRDIDVFDSIQTHFYQEKKYPNERDFFMYQIELMMFMRWRLSADQKFSLPFGLFDLIFVTFHWGFSLFFFCFFFVFVFYWCCFTWENDKHNGKWNAMGYRKEIRSNDDSEYKRN